MAPGHEDQIVASVARLEESLAGFRKYVELSISGLDHQVSELRADTKERRAEQNGFMQTLKSEVDNVLIRVGRIETKMQADDEAAEEKHEARGTFWHPLWVGVIGALALTLSGAMQILIFHFILHIG